MRLELTLQVRQKFLHAGVFSGLIWLAVLLPMPVSLRPVVEPYVLVGDISIIGFFFIGGIVFFEKQERTHRRDRLDAAAVLGVPGRETDCAGADLTVRGGDRGHRSPTGSPTIWCRWWSASCSGRW